MRWLAAIGLCFGLFSSSGAVAQSEQGPIVDPAPPLPDVYMVLFDPGSAALTKAAESALDQLLSDYAVYKPSVLHVNGYYDRSGTETYAKEMSRKMAEAVRDYLVDKGVPPATIHLAWFGEEHPLVETADGVAEPANRSVDVLFDSRTSKFRP